MMHGAIDLREELRNLERFRANFADETDVVIPTPYPERSSTKVLTMSMLTGAHFTDRAGGRGHGLGCRRARETCRPTSTWR